LTIDRSRYEDCDKSTVPGNRHVSCLLCGDHTRDWPAMLEHLRLMHPTVEIQWPDPSPEVFRVRMQL
jgi:hypothetical protein